MGLELKTTLNLPFALVRTIKQMAKEKEKLDPKRKRICKKYQEVLFTTGCR